MYRWMLMGWAVVTVFALPAKTQGQTMQPEDYTCSKVRGTNKKLKLSDIQKGWDDVKRRIKSREQALEYFRKLQDYSFQEAMETGRYASTWISIAFRVVGQYLTCEDKLKIIQRDLEFYRKHEDMLPGTYAWSLRGMECARDFIRSELKNGDLSRMYRGWLIVQASYFWYDEFRDSLFSLAFDPKLPLEFRTRTVLHAIRLPKGQKLDPSSPEYHFVMKALQDTTFVWAETPEFRWGFSKPISQSYYLDKLRHQNRLVEWTDTVQLHGRTFVEKYYRIQHYPIAEKMYDLLIFHKVQIDLPDSILEKVDIKNRDPWARDEQGRPIQYMVQTGIETFYAARDTIEGVEAWYYYWKPWVLQYCEIEQDPGVMDFSWEYQIGGKEAYGYYVPWENRFYLTPLAYSSVSYWDSTTSDFVMFRGMGFAIAACRHENMHRIVDIALWGDAYNPANDQDGDLLPDDQETQGILLPSSWSSYVVTYNPAEDSSHSFYGMKMPDNEHVAMLNACAWPYERRWDNEDWSWGEYSEHFMEVIPDESPPTDGNVRIVFPLRWQEGEKRVVLPGEIKAVAEIVNGEEGLIRWRVDIGGRVREAYTSSGDTVRFQVGEEEFPPNFGNQTLVFGRRMIIAEWVPPVCLASHSPGDGDRGVPVISPIVLSFSRPMDTISVRQGLNITPSFPWQWGFTV